MFCVLLSIKNATHVRGCGRPCYVRAIRAIIQFLLRAIFFFFGQLLRWPVCLSHFCVARRPLAPHAVVIVALSRCIPNLISLRFVFHLNSFGYASFRSSRELAKQSAAVCCVVDAFVLSLRFGLAAASMYHILRAN